jgi:hypothetical protein
VRITDLIISNILKSGEKPAFSSYSRKWLLNQIKEEPEKYVTKKTGRLEHFPLPQLFIH